MPAQRTPEQVRSDIEAEREQLFTGAAGLGAAAGAAAGVATPPASAFSALLVGLPPGTQREKEVSRPSASASA